MDLSIVYPEILLALSSFLLLHLLSLSLRRHHLPINFPVIGMIPYTLLNIGRLHDWCTEILQATGCTVILKGPWFAGFDLLLTCDPANVHHVFNANFPNYPKGGHFADIFDFLGDGIFNSDNDSWRFQRKKAHALMSGPGFRSLVADATKAKVETGLIPLLDLFAGKGDSLELQDVFSRLAFDATSVLVLGVDPGCLSPGLPTVPFADALDRAEEVLFFRHTVPPAWWKLLRRLGFGPEKGTAKAVEVVDRTIARYITEQRERRTRGGADLLSSYLDSEEEIKLHGFEFDKFLRDTTLNLMVAGRDTISSALTWFFWVVAKNPDVEAKILEEVSANSDSSTWVYLHAALCESLRLYPPVPFEHKGVVRPDVLPSGHEVHERRRVFFSLYAMGRMEGVWGKDCMEFRPERWIEPESGRVRREPSWKFFTFNSGSRACIGKDMAFAQMKIVAAAVIGRFRVEVVEGHVARPRLSIILQMKDGLVVRVRRREP